MKWVAFKQMTVGEILDFAQALADASTIEAGDPRPDVMWGDDTIEEAAKELVLDFADAATPFEGTLEMIADTAIAAIANSTDWVDKALGLVRFAAAPLDSKPLASLPF